jgi:hypothetical protein
MGSKNRVQGTGQRRTLPKQPAINLWHDEKPRSFWRTQKAARLRGVFLALYLIGFRRPAPQLRGGCILRPLGVGVMLNLCLVNSILKPHIYPHDYSQNIIEKILLREKFHSQYIFLL